MKKAIILVALLVAFATPAAAQGTAFGVKAGVNFANLNFDPEDEIGELDARTAFTGGILILVPVNARFAFQPEVLFSGQGAKASEGEGEIKLNYVNVPLLANINLTGSADKQFSLIVGPQLGFRTSAKVEEGSEEMDIKDDTESFDFGLVTGVAATFRNFVIDGRYTWGLSNINADDSEDQKVKNRVFTISVGILFR